MPGNLQGSAPKSGDEYANGGGKERNKFRIETDKGKIMFWRDFVKAFHSFSSESLKVAFLSYVFVFKLNPKIIV